MLLLMYYFEESLLKDYYIAWTYNKNTTEYKDPY